MKKIVTLLAVLIMLVLPACSAPATVVDPAVDEPVVVDPVVEEPEVVDPVVEEPIDEAYPVVEEPVVEEQVTIDYAKNFTLEYKDGYELLTVTTPWEGAAEPFQYALVPEGTEVSDDLGDALVVHTPIKSFVSLSTTFLPFLEQIDELSSLVAVDTADYTYNPTIPAWVESGMVQTVGSGSMVDVEKLVELEPDVIMANAFGSEWDTHPALEAAGLPVIINADYLEQNPLGRAEWGKFIAAFYDKEAEIDEIFDAMVERYDVAKALTQDLTEKKTVLVNTPYEGSWSMPGVDSYATIFLTDAGAEYLFNDIPGYYSQTLDFETVFERAKEANVWINVGMATDLASLAAMDERLADFDAYQSGEVYNNNARSTAMGGSDYFESGVANPDVILLDMIKILYPELVPDHTFFYYQQLQ